MAEQKMTVKLDPGQVEVLKQFVRDQIRLARQQNMRISGAGGSGFQEIVEGHGDDRRTLYLSNECNHTQWISDLEVRTGLDGVSCMDCRDGAARHTWRMVWVKA